MSGVKVYRRHNCERQHRTYAVFARCAFRRAAWVVGEGPYALVSWCRFPAVSLHAEWVDAADAQVNLDRLGCGGRCSGRHEVIRLDLGASR